MTAKHTSFLSDLFLRAHWAKDYEAFKDSQEEKALLSLLTNWDKRKSLKETSAELSFVKRFFIDTWGYIGSGEAEGEKFTLYPKLSIPGTGAGGGAGEADLALGYFNHTDVVPQVLCEFKDINSGLDAPQKRKGNTRSPIRQCQDYLNGARRNLNADALVQPHWGIVTDMNEFRLY